MSAKKILWGFLFFCVLEGIIFLGITFYHKKNMESELDTHTRELQAKHGVAINSLGVISEIALEQIKKLEVLELFHHAYFADENQKSALREKVLQQLNPYYIYLKSIGIRQLHFHFPDNKTFLRFHRPTKFGDDLTDIRYSVKMTNETQKRHSGFEEGKTYNGFRFVHPVYFDYSFIGSIEISLSFGAIKDEIALYGNETFSLILKKDIVEHKVTGDEQDNYVISLLSDDYVHEKQFLHYESNQSDLKQLDREIKSKITSQLLEGEDFTIHQKIDNTMYSISFLGIENVEGNHVAYIISYSRDLRYSRLQLVFIFSHIISIVLCTLITLALLTMKTSRDQLQNSKKDLMLLNQNLIEERNVFMIGNVVVIKWKNAPGWPVEYMSSNAENLFGYTPEDFYEGKIKYEDILYKDDIPQIEKDIESAINSNRKSFRHETGYRIYNKKGDILWIDDFTTIIRDKKGEITHFFGYVMDITMRKKNQEELQESKKLYELAMTVKNEGIWEWDLKTDRRIYDPLYYTMAGYEPGEFPATYDEWLKRMHPDDIELSEMYMEKFLNNRSDVYESEFRFLRKDNSYMWIQSRGKIVERDSKGNPLRFLGTHTDISLRKHAEINLNRVLQEQMIILENAPLGIAFIIEKNFVRCNPAFLKIFGYEEKHILNHSIDQIFLSSEFNQFYSELYHNQTFQKEIQLTRKNGEAFWCLISGKSVMTYQSGNSFIWLFDDISLRKEAEENIKSRIEEMSTLNSISREMGQSFDLNTLLSKVAELICELLKSDTTVIDLFSEDYSTTTVLADENRTGTHPESLIGISFPVKGYPILERVLEYRQTFNISDPKANPLTEPIRDLIMARNINAFLVVPLEHRGKILGVINIGTCAIGRSYTEVEVNLVETVSAQIAGAIENATLFDQANRERQKAEESNEAKSVFLAHISHELRTPLNSILGFSQLINQREDISREAKKYLTIIEKSGEHLLNLINDVLSMSKIESGHIELRKNQFDFHHLLEGIKDMFSLKTEESGLQMIFDVSENVPSNIVTDESKLRQVLVNLIGNAVKFTHEGSIHVKVNATDTRLGFSISDTGVGISQDEIDHIFNVFTQAEAGYKSRKGTGLGLPISQQFIQLMGGEIKVESEIGKGTTFSFEINIEIEDNHSPIQIADENKTELTPISTEQEELKILIVDDSDINRLLLSQILSTEECILKEAENGIDALKIWDEWSPQIIFMDMQMPVMDGFEATNRIRLREKERDSLSEYSETWIIAVTASAMEEERTSIKNAGCNDIILKPVALKSVTSILTQFRNRG